MSILVVAESSTTRRFLVDMRFSLVLPRFHEVHEPLDGLQFSIHGAVKPRRDESARRVRRDQLENLMVDGREVRLVAQQAIDHYDPHPLAAELQRKGGGGEVGLLLR